MRNNELPYRGGGRRRLPGATTIGAVLMIPAHGQAVCTPGGDCGLDLGAANAYVTFGNPAALGLATFTVETWFRRDGAGVGNSTGTGGIASLVPLVTKGAPQSDGSNVDANYILGINTGGNVIAADFEEGATGASPGLNHPVSGVTPVQNGQWYHAAATYDGSTWRLYLNGALEAELSVGQPARSDSIQHAGLGAMLSSTGARSGAFDGALDEVRIWNYARTQAEIQTDMLLEISSATGLVARWSLNEGTGTVVGDTAGSAENGTISGSGWSWTDGKVYTSPAPPLLNEPSNGATGTSTSPVLDVSVSDPNGDPLTVTFYGRAVIPAPDFTLIALPDTQYYACGTPCGSNPAIFSAQTQWIVDNQDALNIAYVAQEGDCVEHGNNGNGTPDVEIEWKTADAAFQLIEDPLTTSLADGIPYGIAVGNHDQTPIGTPTPETTTTLYNAYFGESRFLGRAYYGGHYGTNNDNHYSLFSASGMDFIVIYLEYDTSANPAVLAWANGLLQTYADRRGIIVSHFLLNTGNPGSFGAQGQATYDALKANPNLFLMLAGHVPGEGRRSDTFSGNTVATLLSDYQGRSNGGDGWLRILQFSPSTNQIFVKTYSPWLNQFETDADSQFTVPYDMNAGPFDVIATSSGVPSGSAATTVWPSLQPGTTYEWYVEVSDGTTTVVGPTWTFTTSTCGDGIVDGTEQCDDGGTSAGDGCDESCQIELCFTCSGTPSTCSPANGTACNDGVACTTGDVCSGGVCAGTPNNAACNDGQVCTNDVCTAGVGCSHSNNTAACDDGVACTVGDVCAGGVCGGTPSNAACDDGQVCTNDVCTAGVGCSHDHNTAPCDDGIACTVADTCSAGACAGTPSDAACDDGQVCTTDLCTAGIGCSHDNNTSSCDDGIACTTGDACAAGVCAGTPNHSLCDDSEPCTDDLCAAGIGCQYVDNSAACDDGIECTVGDACSGGLCAGTPDDAFCDDSEVCTDDVCTAGVGCQYDNNSAPCDDGLACTTVDICAAGLCTGSVSPDCDDGDPCTTDTCDDVGGCQHAGEPATTCLTALRAQLQIRDDADDTKNRVLWKWQRGAATAQEDFGDPSAESAYTLCIYDASGGQSALAMSLSVDPNGAWLSKAPKGWLYNDKSGAFAGVQQIKLRSGTQGRSSAQVKARGLAIPMASAVGATFFAQDPDVTVQLLSASGTCWTSVFDGNLRNTPEQFRAKSQ